MLFLAHLLKYLKVQRVVVLVTGSGETHFDSRENIMRANRLALDPRPAWDGLVKQLAEASQRLNFITLGGFSPAVGMRGSIAAAVGGHVGAPGVQRRALSRR